MLVFVCQASCYTREGAKSGDPIRSACAMSQLDGEIEHAMRATVEPLRMFRRKSQSANCPWKIPVLHPQRLEELTDLKLDLTTPESC